MKRAPDFKVVRGWLGKTTGIQWLDLHHLEKVIGFNDTHQNRRVPVAEEQSGDTSNSMC